MLVYYAVGGEPGYAALLRESLASLRRFHGPEEVAAAVLCDAGYAPHAAAAVEGLGAALVETPPNPGPVHASRRKAACFDLIPGLAAHDRVLFLDCDTLVLQPLRRLLDADLHPARLHSVREWGPDGHAIPFWSLQLYTPEQLARMEADGTGTFNAGQFMFRPTPEMRAHFDAVQRLLAAHPHGFYEQAAMNHHFNLAGATDESLLTPAVHLFARRPPAPPGALLAHFCDFTLPWPRKLELMREYTRLRQ